MNSIFALDDEELEFSDEECLQTFQTAEHKESTDIHPCEKPLSKHVLSTADRNAPSNESDKEWLKKFKFQKSYQIQANGTKEVNPPFQPGSPSLNETSLMTNSHGLIKSNPATDQENSADKFVSNDKFVSDETGHKFGITNSYNNISQNTKVNKCSAVSLHAEMKETECTRSLAGKKRSLEARSNSTDDGDRTADKRTFDENEICPWQTPKVSLSLSKAEVRSESKRRKLPGPVGALPQLSNVKCLDNLEQHFLNQRSPGKNQARNNTIPTSMDLLSTSDSDDFKKDFWLRFQRNAIESCKGLLYHSISQIHRKANQNLLAGRKVPLMCAWIKSFIVNSTDASVILRDPTGEIKGTVHHNVLENSQTELVPGGCIVLKQVSVFSPSPRKHYVNITPTNIIRLENPQSFGDSQQSCGISSQDQEIRNMPRHETPSAPCESIPASTNDTLLEPTAVEDDLDDLLCDFDDDEDMLAELA